MQAYFWIAVGSALGGMARYLVHRAAARLFGETFPWGTLLRQHSGIVHYRLLRGAHRS